LQPPASLNSVAAMTRANVILAAVAATLLLTATALAQTYGPPQPTRSGYVGKAEGICKKTTQKTNKITIGANKRIKKGDLKAAGKKLVKGGNVFTKGIKKLAALPRPPADKAKLGKWMKSLRVDADLFRQIGKAIGAADQKKINKAIKAAGKHAPKSNKLVAGFGFDWCLVRS
jgi:hypothetical protein